MALIRSDRWQPLPNLEQPRMFELTEFLYLSYLRALIIGVVFTRGFIIAKSETLVKVIETLLHKTTKNQYSDSWRSGIRNTQDAKPARLWAATNLHANLYQQPCIKFHADSVKRKLDRSTDWAGICVGVKSRKKRQLLPKAKALSVRLIIENKSKKTFKIGSQDSTSKNQKLAWKNGSESEYGECQYWMPLNHLNLINSPEGREFHESGR